MFTCYVKSAVGATCLLSRFRDGMRIDRIYTPPQHRGKGIAGELLRKVLAQADREGIALRLIVSSDSSYGYHADSGLSDKQLTKLYASFSFVKEDAIHMVRLPTCANTNRSKSRPKKTAVIGLSA